MEAIMNRQSNKITAIYTRIDYPGNSECIQRQEQALRKYAEKWAYPISPSILMMVTTEQTPDAHTSNGS